MISKLPSNPQFDRAMVDYVDQSLRHSLVRALDAQHTWRCVAIVSMALNIGLIARHLLGL